MEANGDAVLDVDPEEIENALHDLPLQSDSSPVLYCLNTCPPMWYAILLAFYLYVLHLGLTLFLLDKLVKSMGGSEKEIGDLLQTVMLVTGCSTLFQTFFGSRLPVVVGASPQFLIPTSLIITFATIPDPHERFITTVRAIQGAHIVCSIYLLVLGFGGFWRAFLLLLSPLAAAPLLSGAGLTFYKFSFTELGTCMEVGIPMLVVMIFFSLYMPRLHRRWQHIYNCFGFVISVGIVWLYTIVLNYSGAYSGCPITTVNSCQAGRLTLIKESAWFKFPYPFQWGRPTFDYGVVFIMLAAATVSTIESTGTFLAVQRHAGATHIPPSILCRGIGWQGAGLFLNAIFGTVIGSAASNLNAGFIAWTRIGSRRVVQFSAIFMIAISFFGKLQAVISSVPSPIILAVCCICYGSGVSGGLSLLQYCNLNSSRTRQILGWSFFFGFSIPYYIIKERGLNSNPSHGETVAEVVKHFFMTIFTSEATVGVLIAFFMDRTIASNNPRVRRESGSHWWTRYQSYDENMQTQANYALPLGLDREGEEHFKDLVYLTMVHQGDLVRLLYAEMSLQHSSEVKDSFGVVKKPEWSREVPATSNGLFGDS